MAATGGSEELMRFAANLTIDKDEMEQFKESVNTLPSKSKAPVHATTQESETKKHFEAAAEANSTEMLALFGMGLERGKPGHN